MLNFDTKTTKRDGANRFLSPTKKQKMNNVIDLVVRLMNPNTIGFFSKRKMDVLLIHIRSTKQLKNQSLGQNS